MWGGMGTAPSYAAVRLALFYAAFFAVIGIHLPFWPVWLASRGVTPAEIGVLVAVGVSVKVVGNPLIAHIAIAAANAAASSSYWLRAHSPCSACSIPPRGSGRSSPSEFRSSSCGRP